jgi:epoxyqueuosine reductase QueG
MDTAMSSGEREITVCDRCLRACCWQGEFYCDDYKTAGTKKLPISELKRLDREHPDYWERTQ